LTTTGWRGISIGEQGSVATLYLTGIEGAGAITLSRDTATRDRDRANLTIWNNEFSGARARA
jgi:hypothetical protein